MGLGYGVRIPEPLAAVGWFFGAGGRHGAQMLRVDAEFGTASGERVRSSGWRRTGSLFQGASGDFKALLKIANSSLCLHPTASNLTTPKPAFASLAG